jgi:hypothetical protein
MNRILFKLFGARTSRRQVVLCLVVVALIHQLSKQTPDFWVAFDWFLIPSVALFSHWLGLRLQGYRQ